MGLLRRLLCRREPAPDVIVDFDFEDGLLFVALRNMGRGPAFDISVEFDKQLHGVEGAKVIPEMALFRDVGFLPPRKSIRTFLDTSASYFARDEPTELRCVTAFHDRRGRRLVNRMRHNLEIYRDIGYIRIRSGDD